jgi:septum formation protein
VVDSVVKPCLYLASQSPRRRELLQQIGVPHQVVTASVEEIPLNHETAAEYVLRLARAKALAGLAHVQASGFTIVPVLGADTVVVCDDDILEKPRDQAHAAAMLQRLSGRTHQVMTAVALAFEDKVEVELSVTDVVFRELDDTEISAYWHTGEPQDKAGGYGIQGLGAVFVQQIRGSYTGVVGLPIEQTIILLKEFALSWWQQ